MSSEAQKAPTLVGPAKRPTLVLCPTRARDPSQAPGASDADSLIPPAAVRSAALAFVRLSPCYCLHCAVRFFGDEPDWCCAALRLVESWSGVPTFIAEHEPRGS